MTRLADTPPPHCASCFGRPDGKYVDFEAAYDGPVIPGTPEPVPVDDLILCEGCLKEAFDLLDPQEQKETIGELVAIVERQQEELTAKDKAILGSRATINELVDYPVAPQPGKPKLEGLDPEVRKRITQGRYQRRGTSAAPKARKGKPRQGVPV